MTVLAALQFYLFRNEFVFVWIVVGVTAAFLFLYGIFAYPLYKEFDWKFFKIFGTDPVIIFEQKKMWGILRDFISY